MNAALSCDELHELLGAYALDAVSPDEREAIETHLEGCDLHPEAVSLRAAAFALGPVAPVREPPPELERRILSAALAERREAAPAPPAASAEGPVAAPRSPAARPHAWSRLASAPALAAALAVLAIALGAWVTVLLAADDGGEGQRSQLVFSYRGRGGESWLRLETVLGEASSQVTLGGFDRLDDGHAYHLWAIRDERWLRLGFFNTSAEGGWAGNVELPIEDGDEIAVTVGTASGDTRPEGDPLFRSPI